MAALYVYGITDAAGVVLPPAGITGGPLELVTGGRIAAIVEHVELRPSVSVDMLRAQHRLVATLACTLGALLPARFGSIVATRTELRQYLRDSKRTLDEGLDLVRGAAQMTIRVCARRSAAPRRRQHVDAGLPHDAAGAGTEYLRRRAAAARHQHSLPEVQPVLDAATPLVRAQYIERTDTAERLGTVYHLVPRERVAHYTARVRAAADRLARYDISISGPDAAYAFAPEHDA